MKVPEPGEAIDGAEKVAEQGEAEPRAAARSRSTSAGRSTPSNRSSVAESIGCDIFVSAAVWGDSDLVTVASQPCECRRRRLDFPEFEYPPTFSIKNTFVNMQISQSYLDDTYEERRTQSCPPSGVFMMRCRDPCAANLSDNSTNKSDLDLLGRLPTQELPALAPVDNTPCMPQETCPPIRITPISSQGVQVEQDDFVDVHASHSSLILQQHNFILPPPTLPPVPHLGAESSMKLPIAETGIENTHSLMKSLRSVAPNASINGEHDSLKSSHSLVPNASIGVVEAPAATLPLSCPSAMPLLREERGQASAPLAELFRPPRPIMEVPLPQTELQLQAVPINREASTFCAAEQSQHAGLHRQMLPQLFPQEQEHMREALDLSSYYPSAELPSPVLSSSLGKLPSKGSADHHLGTCRPCAYFGERGCGNGAHCQFCHLCPPGELKRRQKAKRSLQRQTRFLQAHAGF